MIAASFLQILYSLLARMEAVGSHHFKRRWGKLREEEAEVHVHYIMHARLVLVV